jgi:hypothetical protein
MMFKADPALQSIIHAEERGYMAPSINHSSWGTTVRSFLLLISHAGEGESWYHIGNRERGHHLDVLKKNLLTQAGT